MAVIVTVLNSSQSSAITLSSINFRGIENIMLSELLAFVQTSILIKTAPLCSKLLFAEAHRCGWNGRKRRKKRTVWKQTTGFQKAQGWMQKCCRAAKREDSRNVIHSSQGKLTCMWVKNTPLHHKSHHNARALSREGICWNRQQRTFRFNVSRMWHKGKTVTLECV